MRHDLIAIGLLWAAMPVTHLLDLGYTFFAFEVWAMSALFLITGSALAYGFGKLGLQSVLVAVSLFLLICIYFLDTSGLQIAWLVVLFAALYMLHRKAGRQTLPVISTFAVIFSLSNVVLPKTDPFATTKSQPFEAGEPRNALLHIILDEQASLDAMAHTIPPQHPALSIYEDYAQRGFKTYRTVRSVHYHTNQSLPNLVSLNGDTENLAPFERDDDHILSVRQNPQIQELVAQGYRVRVRQSSYLDFCVGVPNIDCRSYPIRDMSVFQTSDLGLDARLLTAFLAISRDYRNLQSGRYIGAYKAISNALYTPVKSYRYLSWPMKTLEAIELLETELQEIQPGDAFIAHLLLPHFPYILSSDCKPQTPNRWAYPVRQGPKQNLQDIHLAYWDQTACSHRKIMQLLDAIADKPFVTVMIHGDHGARFQTETDAASEEDDLDTFLMLGTSNTLSGPAIDERSLQDIFAKEFDSFLDTNRLQDLRLN